MESKFELFISLISKLNFDEQKPLSINNEETKPIFDKIFETYELANEKERKEISKFVSSKKEHYYKLLFWENNELNEIWVKNRLIGIAIRKGYPDMRDDLVELNYLWQHLDKLKIDNNLYFKDFLSKFDSTIISNFFKGRANE